MANCTANGIEFSALKRRVLEVNFGGREVSRPRLQERSRGRKSAKVVRPDPSSKAQLPSAFRQYPCERGDPTGGSRIDRALCLFLPIL